MKYQELKEQICDVCHKMWQLGWVAANDGNVTVLLPDGNLMATPTGVSVCIMSACQPSVANLAVRALTRILLRSWVSWSRRLLISSQ